MNGQITRYTLKELRARKNLTQKQMSSYLGISQQTYNAWEKDISNVGVSKVNAIAKFFNITLDEILFDDKHENNSCNKKKEVG